MSEELTLALCPPDQSRRETRVTALVEEAEAVLFTLFDPLPGEETEKPWRVVALSARHAARLLTEAAAVMDTLAADEKEERG